MSVPGELQPGRGRSHECMRVPTINAVTLSTREREISGFVIQHTEIC